MTHLSDNNFIDTKNYTFRFGKYKDELYEDVLALDPFYIQWCAESIEWFTLSPDDQEIVDLLCEKGTRR